MSYEFGIGWRYVYRGDRSRRATIGLVVSLIAIAFSLYLLLTSGGSSPLGVAILSIGLLSTVLFVLLEFFSVFTTVSVLGVVLGVAALTVVLAVTTGFQKQFREKVLGVNAHVIIMKNTTDFRASGPLGYLNVERIAKEIDPDVIAYSVTTGRHRFYRQLNLELKRQLDFFAVFGGPHATFFPDFVEEEGVDAVCRGEGEYPQIGRAHV